jgi:hypothetical protein
MPSTNVRSAWVAGNLEYRSAADPSVKLGGVVNVLGSTTKAGGTLAVPITHRVCVMTTGGVEALTLANGVPGQRLTLVLGTDGGDGTLTPVTKTGYTTIVFADAFDTVSLEYISDTIGWIVTGTGGVATKKPTLG